MYMQYNKIQFTSGLTGFAYQEIDGRGICIAYLDELGQEIMMTDVNGASIVCESSVIDDNCITPFSHRVPPEPSIDKEALRAVLTQAFATFAETDPVIAEAIRNDILSRVV